MPDTLPKDAPLEVTVKDGKLTISIGIDTLAFCSAPENTGPLEGCRVEPGKEEEFAKDVAEEIEREDHDGSTPLSQFLDKMMDDAASMGSGALIYDDTPCSDKKDEDEED